MAKKKAKKKVAKKVVKKAAPKKATPKAMVFKSMEDVEEAFRKHCKVIVKDTMKKFGLGNIAIIGTKVGFPSEDQIVTLVAMDGSISKQDIMAWGHTVMATYESRVKQQEAEKKEQEAELEAATVVEQPIEEMTEDKQIDDLFDRSEHEPSRVEPQLQAVSGEEFEELNDSSEDDDDEDFEDDDDDDDNDEGYF